MAPRLKVVDASVLAALLFGEPRAEEAAELVEGCQLVAPSLLRYEIASVCLKKILRVPRQGRVLVQALGLLDAMGVQEVGAPAVEVLELARRKNVTVYDAAYLWVAEALEVPLATFDEQLDAARKKGAS